MLHPDQYDRHWCTFVLSICPKIIIRIDSKVLIVYDICLPDFFTLIIAVFEDFFQRKYGENCKYPTLPDRRSQKKSGK